VLDSTTSPRPLPELAAAILDAHTAFLKRQEAALDHVRRAGALLLEVRHHSDLSHGEWLPWLAANRPEISERVAQMYMRIAREWPRLVELAKSETRVSDFPTTIREALKMLADDLSDPNELGAGGNNGDDGDDGGGCGGHGGTDPDSYPQRFQICLDGKAMRAFRANVVALRSNLHTSNKTDTVVKAIAMMCAALNEREDDYANDTVDGRRFDARL
jgi:hypothetical protein